MIEVIYKEEQQEAKGNKGMFSIPRNIRQIGLSCDNYRIYVEDYVYTFLGKIAAKTKEQQDRKGSLAILLGETKWTEGITYVFIRGALGVEDTETAADHIEFTEEMWLKIHEQEEKYFPNQEIVGWFYAQPELVLEATELLKRVHLKHFGGGEKVLMLMDPTEREDAFFKFENGFLVKQPGYYLYYEKNPMMQTYMIEKKEILREESVEKVEDEAVKSFRKIIKKKRKEETDDKEDAESGISIFSYAATACLAFAVLAVGVNFYQNYQEVQKIDQQVETASAVIDDEIEENKEENEQSFESDKMTMAYPTVTPLIQPTDTPMPDKNEGKDEESDTESDNDSLTDTSHFYREESDIRKAKQKETLAKQQEISNETASDDVSTEKISVGEEGAKEEETEETSASGSRTSYVIRPGDTLYQISIEKYGNMDAISEICRLNGLKENEIIYPGQVIVLP